MVDGKFKMFMFLSFFFICLYVGYGHFLHSILTMLACCSLANTSEPPLELISS